MAAPASDAGYRFYPARLKAAGYVGGGAIITTVAALMIAVDAEALETPHVMMLSVMCAIAVPLYGWFAARWLRVVLHRGPLIEIDPIGITDHRLGPDPIPWSIVRTVRFGHAYRRPFLELTLEGRRPQRRARFALPQFRSAPSETTVAISLVGLDARPDFVLDAIRDAFHARNQLEPLAAGPAAA